MWRHWINKEGKPLTGRYYEFKTFKVYWAYRHMEAEKVDRYNAITPIKKLWGNVIELTNYAEKYK